MRTHSFIKITLIGMLLLCANAGPHAWAEDAGALRNLQVDDYFALKRVGNPGSPTRSALKTSRMTEPHRGSGWFRLPAANRDQ